MSGYTRWQDIRAEYVERAGGEEAVRAGKEELLAEVTGHRLAELRRARGLTQQQVADRMGVTKGRVSQMSGQGLRPGGAGPLRDRSRRASASGDLLRRRGHRRDCMRRGRSRRERPPTTPPRRRRRPCTRRERVTG